MGMKMEMEMEMDTDGRADRYEGTWGWLCVDLKKRRHFDCWFYIIPFL